MSPPRRTIIATSARLILNLGFGADRASQNYGVLIRILIQVEKNPKVIAHVDFCGGHGVALARSRPKPSKRLSTALSALTKWLRVDSNVSQVAKTLEDLVHWIFHKPFLPCCCGW